MANIDKTAFKPMTEEEKKRMTGKPENNISHPAHYAEGRDFEPIDVINDWDLNFNLGNAVKYISRAGRKDLAIEDLEKARWYLDYEINRLKTEDDFTLTPEEAQRLYEAGQKMIKDLS